jgi:anion-transporting  ArsA/GET3 family ATPase
VRPKDALQEALESCRILIACGSGGVGKTSTSAALALRAAGLGRRVLVCTIDPSPRLATALGLSELKESPEPLDLRRLSPRPAGSLSAMTLDTKRTFDALVERFAPDAKAKDRVLKNRFYQHVSSALSGSQEYMAMEKLLELQGDPRFDLVVLDTPPTRHALDFLEAPDRLLGFLDTSVLRYFLKPYFIAGRLTLKVATRTGAFFLSLADRALGLEFLQDLSEFFLAFEGMYDGFKERAGRVHALLREEGSGFVLVSSAAPTAVEEALYFRKRLAEKGMPFVSFVVNRVHPPLPRGGLLGPAVRLPGDLAERLVAVARDQETLSRLERKTVARLTVDAGDPVLTVPEFETDIHDLHGLWQMAGVFAPTRPAGSRP